MRVVAILVLALSMSGCSSETVYLRNMVGDQVQCGPYSGVTAIYLFSLVNCREEFQKAGYQADILEDGYERVQGPQ